MAKQRPYPSVLERTIIAGMLQMNARSGRDRLAPWPIDGLQAVWGSIASGKAHSPAAYYNALDRLRARELLVDVDPPPTSDPIWSDGALTCEGDTWVAPTPRAATSVAAWQESRDV